MMGGYLMLKDNIYNEIEKANTCTELIEIKNKIIRAEHFGHLDAKSADILLEFCAKRLYDKLLAESECKCIACCERRGY